MKNPKVKKEIKNIKLRTIKKEYARKEKLAILNVQ